MTTVFAGSAARAGTAAMAAIAEKAVAKSSCEVFHIEGSPYALAGAGAKRSSPPGMSGIPMAGAAWLLDCKQEMASPANAQ
jgi:hypothetical protein